MKKLPRTSQSIVRKPIFSRSLLPSLICSLLLHLTAFAFSCNWTISSEDHSQPILVELIDAPVHREDHHTMGGEGLEQKGGKRTVQTEKDLHRESTPTPHYLSAKSDFFQETSPESDDTVPAHFDTEATVSLDSQELKYVSYLSKIKKKIEPLWQYPEKAQAIGLQGKLALYFSIVRDGRLDRLELLSSSGHSLLDEQALKAIRGAAPYYPLPDRLHISRLNIHATFEYRISPYTMSTFAQSPHEERL
jgi:TonB family protein